MASALFAPAGGLACKPAAVGSFRSVSKNGSPCALRPAPSHRAAPTSFGRGQSRKISASALPAVDYSLLWTLGDYGDVDAPNGALIVGAIVVTLAITAAVPLLLAPGDNISKQLQDRDKKSFNKKR